MEQKQCLTNRKKQLMSAGFDRYESTPYYHTDYFEVILDAFVKGAEFADAHPDFNRKHVGKLLDILFENEINPIISKSLEEAKDTLYDYACEYNNGYRDSLIKTIEEHGGYKMTTRQKEIDNQLHSIKDNPNKEGHYALINEDSNYFETGFVLGVEWADNHPSDETISKILNLWAAYRESDCVPEEWGTNAKEACYNFIREHWENIK